MAKRFATLSLTLGFLGATTLQVLATDWPVFGFDSARSGYNSAERSLTVANVHRLRERWQISLPAVADSTPILLQHVRVGRAYRTMLFQTTKPGETLGIEADTGRIVWHFSTHGPQITDSTPAADPSDTSIYVPGVDGKVHKLGASKGHEEGAPGFPARITRIPTTEKDASPLNVANGYLYAVTSGYNGDATPYDGHVVSVRLSDGTTAVLNSLCSQNRRLPGPHSCPQQRSGIWARGGAVVDPDPSMGGRIYTATGNGDFSANTGGHNYGDSVISRAISPLSSETTRQPITTSWNKAIPILGARRRPCGRSSPRVRRRGCWCKAARMRYSNSSIAPHFPAWETNCSWSTCRADSSRRLPFGRMARTTHGSSSDSPTSLKAIACTPTRRA